MLAFGEISVDDVVIQEIRARARRHRQELVAGAMNENSSERADFGCYVDWHRKKIRGRREAGSGRREAGSGRREARCRVAPKNCGANFSVWAPRAKSASLPLPSRRQASLAALTGDGN